jgi:hypothetical protein
MRRVGLVLLAVLLIVAGWVLPAIYHARYDPETKNGAVSSSVDFGDPILTSTEYADGDVRPWS